VKSPLLTLYLFLAQLPPTSSCNSSLIRDDTDDRLALDKRGQGNENLQFYSTWIGHTGDAYIAVITGAHTESEV